MAIMGEREFGYGGWGAEGLVTDMLVPLLGMLVPLLLLAGVALVTILLLRRAKLANPGEYHTAPPPHATDPALTILRERYARGELATAEYEERRHRLLDGPESF
jgi:uncharacterized membrane protein